MEIVINTCFGGYGLSKKAILRYAELKGIKLYKGDSRLIDSFYLVPEEEYLKVYEKDKLKGNYSESNKLYFSEYGIERTDPVLIQVIRELGSKANGDCAKLEIIEIPDDIEWEIAEYDGVETVEEKHRSWS